MQCTLEAIFLEGDGSVTRFFLFIRMDQFDVAVSRYVDLTPNRSGSSLARASVDHPSNHKHLARFR
jgi:hypothetical protein